jgi:hypothetical protein
MAAVDEKVKQIIVEQRASRKISALTLSTWLSW